MKEEEEEEISVSPLSLKQHFGQMEGKKKNKNKKIQILKLEAPLNLSFQVWWRNQPKDGWRTKRGRDLGMKT